MSDQTIDKEKSTLTVDESDILAMSEKIRQNQEEDRAFAEQLDSFLQEKMPAYERFHLGDTPNILKIIGSQASELVVNQNEIKNAMADKSEGLRSHSEGHEISVENIMRLTEKIRNPILVLRGNAKNPNSVVLLTELQDKQGHKVIAPISLNRENGHVDRIASLYGKENIEHYLQIHCDEILAVNTEKADQLYKDIGFQLPTLNTVICFDNSIAYSTANVKRVSEKSLEITRETESQTRRGAKKPFGQAQLTQSVKTAKEAERQSPPEQTKKKDEMSR